MIFRKTPVTLLTEATAAAARARADANSLAQAAQQLSDQIEANAAKAVELPGGLEAVHKAYLSLAELLMRRGDLPALIACLDSFRKYHNGPQAVIAFASSQQLLESDKIDEQGLLKLSEWFSEAGLQKELAGPLTHAVERRFRRSLGLTIALADVAAAEEKYDLAARRLRQAWELRPNDGLRLKPRLEKLREAAPKNHAVLMLLGQITAVTGSSAEAATYLSQALRLGALSSEALFALTDAYTSLNRWNEVAGSLEQLIELRADPAQVVARCRTILDRLPTDELEANRRIQRALGDALVAQGRYDEALAPYRSALESAGTSDLDRRFAATLVDRLQVTASQNAGHGPTFLLLGQAYRGAGKPEQGLDALEAAAKCDTLLLARVVDTLRDVVADAPASLRARLLLVDTCVANRDPAAALDAVQETRKVFPNESAASGQRLLQILQVLSLEHHDDQALANGPLGSVLRGVLLSLAEDEATSKPDQASQRLERLLQAFGKRYAHVTLEQLTRLGLPTRAPLSAALLAGDAHTVLQRYDTALRAYAQAPVTPASAPAICAHLEKLALVDGDRPNAPLLAADTWLTVGQIGRAVSLLRLIFAQDPGQVAQSVVDRLLPLHEGGAGLAEGQDLLLEALLVAGPPDRLERAHGLIPGVKPTPEQGVRYARAICEQAPSESSLAAAGHLLLADALAVQGKVEEAIGEYRAAAGHRLADARAISSSLEEFVRRYEDAADAWLALGDTRARCEPPLLSEALAAYSKALHLQPKAMARPVRDRAAGLARGDCRLPARLLHAEATAHTDRPDDAPQLLWALLQEQPSQAAGAVRDLCSVLPDAPNTWLLAAEASAHLNQVDKAEHYLRLLAQRGTPAEIAQAEKRLGVLAERFPTSSEPLFGQALALRRLSRPEKAAHILATIAQRFPGSRPQALLQLHELTAATGLATVWLEQARAQYVDNKIPEALRSLEPVIADPATRTTAHDDLLAMRAAHPDRNDVLEKLIQAESLGDSAELLAQAVARSREWLTWRPADAERIIAVAESSLRRLQQFDLGGSSVALAARLLLADALTLLKRFDEAAGHLGAVTTGWPASAAEVISRAEQTLAERDVTSTRVVLVDAHLQQAGCAPALAAAVATRDSAEAASRAFAERCRLIVTAARDTDLKLAAQAAFAEAEFDARLQDAPAVLEAIGLAAQLHEESLPEAQAWLFRRPWDEPSRRTLLYGAAHIAIAGREPRWSVALERYSNILEWRFDAEAQEVLTQLEGFPDDYLPAWEMRLAIHERRGPSAYPAASLHVEKMLDVYGAAQADLLAVYCDRLDQASSQPHLMRSRILEVQGRLEEAADALLALQTSLPDALAETLRALRALINRHPDAPNVTLRLGDAFRNAENWDDAIGAYERVRQAAPVLAPDLTARVKAVLDVAPAHAASHWALARLYAMQDDVTSAADHIDELTDVAPEEGEEALQFLLTLVAQHPNNALTWYTLGKLSHRQALPVVTIERLERALQCGGVTETREVLLHDMLGQAYRHEGALDSALSNFRLAARLRPDDPALSRSLLTARLRCLERDIAEQEAHANETGALEDHLKLARLLTLRGWHDRAVTLLQSLLPLARAASIHLALARTFSAQQRPHLAETSAREALTAGTLGIEETKEALLWLGQAQRHQLDFEHAAATFQQLCALDSSYQNVQGLLSAVQHERSELGCRSALLPVIGAARFPIEE